MEVTNTLMHDLSTTEQHTSQIEADVKTVDRDLNSIDNDLKISKKINTSLNELNSALGEAEELLEVVSIIPEIGAEASELKNTIAAFQRPIAEALAVSDKLESVVAPVRTKIEAIEPKVKQIDTVLLKTMNIENQFISILGGATQCINSLPAGSIKSGLESELNTASKNLDPVVLDFDKVQTALLAVVNTVKSDLNNIIGVAQSLLTISTQIDAVLNIINPLIKSLNAVKNALSHTIRVPYGGYPKVCYKHVLGVKVPYPCGWHTVYFSFSVEQIIKGGLGVLAPVMDLLNKAMNAFLSPILNTLHLNINLPSIPGLSKLSALLNTLEGFSNIETLVEQLWGDISVFNDFMTKLEAAEAEFNKISKACSISAKTT